MKEIKQETFTFKMYSNFMEITIKEGSHIDTSKFLQILEFKKENYKVPIGILVIRNETDHSYSIDPMIFLNYKNEFEKHCEWYALISPNRSGFENLFYLKEMTSVKTYAFTSYEEASNFLQINFNK